MAPVRRIKASSQLVNQGKPVPWRLYPLDLPVLHPLPISLRYPQLAPMDPHPPDPHVLFHPPPNTNQLLPATPPPKGSPMEEESRTPEPGSPPGLPVTPGKSIEGELLRLSLNRPTRRPSPANTPSGGPPPSPPKPLELPVPLESSPLLRLSRKPVPTASRSPKVSSKVIQSRRKQQRKRRKRIQLPDGNTIRLPRGCTHPAWSSG